MSPTARRPPRHPSTAAALIVAFGLVILVVVVFGRTLGDRFFVFDDPSYVTANALVQQGLTREGVRWALTTSDSFYWHPITWLSHMADVQLFGLDPAGHHATNVALHAATTVLVFVAFAYMTGAFWRSALLAAVFAVHPLHVEPVAWVAERKELLAGFFWFAAILAYAFYARHPSRRRYALCAALFVLGLMSKPVVVSLPFVLLLLDVWPLQRWSAATRRGLVLEKLPLLALSIGSSVLTYVGQRRAGAMTFLAHATVASRLQHALVGYAIYVGQLFWPHPLAPLYPYAPTVSPLALVASAALLIGVTAAALALRARAPFLLVGWLWFLGVLVPMIGLVQVGAQSHADRFAYLAIVGLCIVLIWGGATWLAVRVRPASKVALSAILIAALTVVSSAQARHWTDSVSLLTHTIAVTDDNPVALHLLGFALASEGRLADAVPYYRESLRLNPRNPLGQYNLGLALAALQRPAEALETFAEAARQHPSYAEAHYSLGATLLELNRREDARRELETAVRLPLQADYAAQAYFRLGLIGAYDGDLVRARDGFAEALRLQPNFLEARANLARALALLNGRASGHSQ